MCVHQVRTRDISGKPRTNIVQYTQRAQARDVSGLLKRRRRPRHTSWSYSSSSAAPHKVHQSGKTIRRSTGLVVVHELKEDREGSSIQLARFHPWQVFDRPLRRHEGRCPPTSAQLRAISAFTLFPFFLLRCVCSEVLLQAHCGVEAAFLCIIYNMYSLVPPLGSAFRSKYWIPTVDYSKEY